MSFAEDPTRFPEELDVVEELFASCLEREPSERRGAFEELCCRHPEHSGPLRQRWEALAEFGLVDSGEPAAPEFPASLGDFDLVRRLGGGGMGVVFLAVQRSLSREVALKVMRPEQVYFPNARARFRREAEAVAKLSHPGIVPIYVVGEESAAPYFAMERVVGCTLAEALAALRDRAPESLTGGDLYAAVHPVASEGAPSSLPGVFGSSWVDACVAIALQVADALEHAHSRGVLHRDVKPSNVMLTPDGRARLVDFGLTALVDQDGPTKTGAQLGTLHYMSPEQLRAQGHVDARTDVYGLGVTLYELLTLQVPYRGSSAVETQARILDARPDPIRARNRSVSQDVETVCAVAMERDAGRRYASARALREDLERLLERLPIRARPIGPLRRAARMAARRPALSAALAAVFLLSISLPSVLFVQARAHAKELAKSLASEREAHGEARRQQEAALASARDAARANELAQGKVRTAQAELDFLTNLYLDASPMGRIDESTSAFELLERGGAEIHTTLASEPAARAQLQAIIARIWIEHGRFREAIPLLEASLETARASTEPIEFRREAAPELKLAEAWLNLGELERAEPYFESYFRGVGASADPAERALIYNAVAVLASRSRDVARAENAIEELARLHETTGNVEVASHYAAGLVALGQMRAVAGDPRSGAQLAERAVEIQRAALEPEDPELFQALSILGSLHRACGNVAEAERDYEESVCVARANFPGDSVVVARTLINWAILRGERGDLVRAELLMEEADRVAASAAGERSRERAQTLYGLGRIALDRGHRARAVPLLVQAIEVLSDYDDAHSQQSRGFALQGLARDRTSERDSNAARALYEEALDLFQATPGCARDANETLALLAGLER